MGAVRHAVASPLMAYLGTITKVDTAAPAAAITFDDGPDPRFLPPLLDLLDRFDVKATFFAIGTRAARHPDLMADVERDRRGRCRGVHLGDSPEVWHER